MKRNFLMLMVAVLFGLSSSYAQQKTITGQVKDAGDGVSLPGVTVSVLGQSRSVQTNANGQFSIEAESSHTLRFAYIGYQAHEVMVGNQSSINVNLQQSAEALGEVVVTAMGIKREKKALGYAVQDIKSEELLKNKDANIINSLNGKIAGINVTNSGGAPGSSASIVIRGGTSLERDNQPLFVIDGMPVDNSTGQGDNSSFDGSTNISTTHSNRAMDINPEDIESISVLKGPAAAALYGLRAAAGAIVITTKKGSEGATTVSFNSRLSSNWVSRLPEQQSMYKQGTYYNGTFSDETSRSWGDQFTSGETVYDNMGDFFKTATALDNSLNISGGNKDGNFYLSASNLHQGGVVPTTDYDRTTLRFNGEQTAGKFTFGVNASYSQSNSRKTLTGSGLWSSGGSGYMESIIAWPRNDDMSHWLNEDGTKHRLLPNIPLENDSDNPYWLINKNPQKDENKRLVGSVYTTVKVTDWFEATYRLGIDNYLTKHTSFTAPGSSVKEAWQNGMLSESNRNYNYYNSNLMLNFHKEFNDEWDFNLLLGTSAENTQFEANSARAENFTIPSFTSINNAAKEDQYFNQAINGKRLIGAYGDFRVGYRDMLYLNVTGRNDWSSTLPIENRSFFYPSASLSFIFTELLDLENSALSFGKLRASYAQVGKDAPAYQTNTYLFGPELTLGGGYRNNWTRGNDILKPETTTSIELGTELRFLKNRLGVDFTYYKNESKDQILQPRVSNATGYILSYVNTGTIENQGIELSINATPVRNDNFTWETTLNFSHNKGVVKELPGALPVLYVTDVQVGNAKAASFDGGHFMGLSGSLWQTNDDGDLLLDWNTGYPLTSTLTTTPVGNREPKFIGGLNNSFTFNDWNFSFLLDFRKGGDVYNGTGHLLNAYGLAKHTEDRGETISFTGQAMNPVTKEYESITKDVVADEKYYRDIYSNHAPFFIEEVNWLRLRSVSLAYALPQSLLNRAGFIKGASLTATGTNLLLWTNYSGVDPETSAAGAGVIGSGSVGIDYAGIPSTAGVTFGINVKF